MLSSKSKVNATPAAVEPVKVYKWDGVAVKNALDDVITEVRWTFWCFPKHCLSNTDTLRLSYFKNKLKIRAA